MEIDVQQNGRIYKVGDALGAAFGERADVFRDSGFDFGKFLAF
jgi:hypothetical protein